MELPLVRVDRKFEIEYRPFARRPVLGPANIFVVGLDHVGFRRTGRPDNADQREWTWLGRHSGVQFCAFDHVGAGLADLGADDVQRAMNLAQ